jgi:hypothetical protein
MAKGQQQRESGRSGVGLAVQRRARAGGLGKMKDYGKRQAEVPNPYAPPQVWGRDGGCWWLCIGGYWLVGLDCIDSSTR